MRALSGTDPLQISFTAAFDSAAKANTAETALSASVSTGVFAAQLQAADSGFANVTVTNGVSTIVLPPSSSSTLPKWAIAVIVLVVIGAAAVIGFCIRRRCCKSSGRGSIIRSNEYAGVQLKSADNGKFKTTSWE